ncbi:MAG: hypothetical protein IKX44_11580 [Prevotella sp.]|nr:hypothetical protein [Prevotella sp.]
MDELRPKIKPKAPASLKENVLQAVRKESRQTPSWWKVTRWAAAAMFLIGIFTFALWLNEEDSSLRQAKVVKTAAVDTQFQKKPQPLISQIREGVEPRASRLKAKPTQTQSLLYQTKATREPSVSGSRLLAMTAATSSIDNPPETSAESTLSATELRSAPIANQEEDEGESSLTPYEQQLITNLETHRHLVKACLAEELAQVRYRQSHIAQQNQQYIQEYLDLQRRIRQQISEDIDNINPHKTPKEV